MKEIPSCCLCGKPALVYMISKYFCGVCVADWDKRNKEKIFKQMQEDMK